MTTVLNQSMDFSKLTWAVRRLYFKLGWQGISAIALALLVCVLTVGVILPVHGELEDMQEQLMHSYRQQPNMQVAVVTPEQGLAKELATFEAEFSGIEHLTDELGVLFRLAQGHGLEVHKGEYTLVEKKQGVLRSFEANVPVTGSYQQVKALVLDVLESLPNVALAELSFERGEVAENQVKTRLRLVFFIRKRAV
ncbi:hypothetical protein LG201_12525 [Methylobacillus gramineus]|uniref:hypothetical protein n=1 Tax=Methylobacillus gramineus TaxID=755169 RepID=UPI001CFFBEF0|nr:hypothetical protein [Methylobacillus gramineus]MCB5186031.1 hypothetical protein [Methylobacillus gramineus]